MAGLAASWYRVLQPKGLAIVQVMRMCADGGEPTVQDLKDWAALHGASYPVVRDAWGALPRLRADETATTIVIDRHQEIRLQGAPTQEELLEVLQQILIHED